MALSKIKTSSIADDAVTSAKLATGGIATIDMADGSVTSLKIADGAIATVDIANAAITPVKLSAGAPTWTSTNIIGIGATPNTGWNSTNSTMSVIQFASGGALGSWNSGSQSISLWNNAYDTGGGVQKRVASGYVAKYDLGGGTHTWGVAASGAADSTISSWNNSMIMDTAGTVAIADSSLTNFVSTNAGSVKLYVSSGVNGWPVTSGTTQTNGALRIRGGDNAVMDFGVNSSNGAWIQVTDKANLVVGNAYPLRLQPTGGAVVIGSTSISPAATLDVLGGSVFRKSGTSNDGGAAALFRKSDNTGGMWIAPNLSGGQYNSYVQNGDAALISGVQYGPMVVGTHDGNAIRFSQNSTVVNTAAMGIGTQSITSGYVLEVAGNAKIQGGILNNGFIYGTYCNAGTWTTIMSIPANYDNTVWGHIQCLCTENGGAGFYEIKFYAVTRHNGSPYGDFFQLNGGLQYNGSLHGASSQASIRMTTAAGDNTTKYIQVNGNSYGMGFYVYKALISGPASWV